MYSSFSDWNHLTFGLLTFNVKLKFVIAKVRDSIRELAFHASKTSILSKKTNTRNRDADSWATPHSSWFILISQDPKFQLPSHNLLAGNYYSWEWLFTKKLLLPAGNLYSPEKWTYRKMNILSFLYWHPVSSYYEILETFIPSKIPSLKLTWG